MQRDPFDLLQDILVSLRVGDKLTPGEAADATGLTPEICRAMLVGLERAGLMAHETESADCFVRCALEVLKCP